MKKRKNAREETMESSYKKLAKQRDETIFILKTQKRKLEALLLVHKESEVTSGAIAYALTQFQELFKLYEIE